ncbi:MAG: glycosyltransferase family 4 protein [Phreatobacter sp.]
MTQPVKAVFAIPGDIATPTGGYRYDREVLARAGRSGLDLTHLALPGSFPFPTDADLAATRELFGSLPGGAVLLADGLAFGALPPAVLDAIAVPVVALVHHPLALESGLPAATAARLAASERQALARASAVIVTSPATARILVADYAVPGDRITVAMPGTEPAPRATGSGNEAPMLLAVGAVSARKGYEVLMDALGPLKGLDWTLVIAGATDRDRDAFASLRRAVVRHGLARRVTFAGALSDEALDRLYGLADIFVMASLYEGYGMVLAEAMAHGLPIVTTTGGAAAETVPDGAALKVPPGDAAALKAAIARAIGDRALRRSLADAAFAAGVALPRWDDTARIVAAVIRDVAGGPCR